MCILGCNRSAQSPPSSGSNAGQACDATTTPCPVCTPSSVTLAVGKPTLTLKHDRETTVTITVQPATVSVDSYRIEIRRASGTVWCTLDNTRALNPWRAKIAGKFKLRGVVRICGIDHLTAEQDVEVRYPSYAEITADATVRAALDAAWTATESDCTQNPNQRRERGFWVRLNTTSDQYETTAVEFGAFAGPAAGASVNLSGRPTDAPAAPDPCAAGATYSVASFHTHTPTSFRAVPGGAPAGSARPIGPSGADNIADNNDDVPGIVYDYTEAPAGSGSIPMGHPLGSPAQLYHSRGRDRRTTPN